MTRVDVVIPCFNYGLYLERCVRSVLDQPAVNVRVLIIDDCSTDNTSEIGGQLASLDRRVSYRRHQVNQGHIATYNEGLLGWATGDYCLLISADDLVTPGALLRATLVMDSYPKAGLCYGSQIVFSDVVPELPPTPPTAAITMSSGADFWQKCCRAGQNGVATPTALVRTSIHHAAGGYKKELPHAADLELWLRIAARSDVASIDVPQAFKRMHGQNMQLHYLSAALEDLRQRHAAFESAIAECRPLVDDAAKLTQTFRRSLSMEALWRGSSAFDEGQIDLCTEWLALATSIDPTIVRSGEWRRFSAKRRLGFKIWRTLHPWVDWMRA